MKCVAVVGGGAAGLMAAASILEDRNGVRVVLLEKNSVLGRKVVISGGGRCNLTTGIQNISTLLKNYPRGNKFLRFAMYEFSPRDVYEWFENHDVPLKTEADMRVFPQSNRGGDVVDVFKNIFEKFSDRCEVKFNTSLEGLTQEGDKFILNTSKGELKSDAVILTTGGQAYRFTGSAGDGYSFAETFGHKISDLAPSLNSFLCREKWVVKLAGVSLESVEIKAKSLDDKKKKYQFKGGVLFTHKGISGPAVFALSSLTAFESYNKDRPMKIFIDFVTDKNEELVRETLWKNIQNTPNKEIRNVCKHLFPGVTKSMWEVCFKINDIDSEQKAADFSKKSLNKCVQFLKACELEVVGRGEGSEFVTAGGVSLNEVDFKTMESKKQSGLHFAGELLNIDAFTGGFNLQAAWASGRCAGLGVKI